jgi:hypothetical protein
VSPGSGRLASGAFGRILDTRRRGCAPKLFRSLRGSPKPGASAHPTRWVQFLLMSRLCVSPSTRFGPESGSAIACFIRTSGRGQRQSRGLRWKLSFKRTIVWTCLDNRPSQRCDVWYLVMRLCGALPPACAHSLDNLRVAIGKRSF